jgi:hypothetical protein
VLGGKRECGVCRAVEGEQGQLWLCSGCMAVRYCGKACQQKDWKGHRAGCRLVQRAQRQQQQQSLV